MRLFFLLVSLTFDAALTSPIDHQQKHAATSVQPAAVKEDGLFGIPGFLDGIFGDDPEDEPTPDTTDDRSPPPDTKLEVEPMECGALIYLHLGKTGGTSVDEHLEKFSAKKAGYSYHRVWWGTAGDSDNMLAQKYNYTHDASWQNFRGKVYSQNRPKVLLTMHHGVPGIGAYLWEHELQPMKNFLQRQGCDLRVVTALREGVSRLESSFDFHTQLTHAKSAACLEGLQTDGCMCQFAKRRSNVQAATIMFGHLAPQSIWGTRLRAGAASDGDFDNPLKNIAECWPDCKDDVDHWTWQVQKVVDEKFALVGCTEDLDSFTNAIDLMLGLPGDGKLPIANPSKKHFEYGAGAMECLRSANLVDNSLHKRFCPALHMVPSRKLA